MNGNNNYRAKHLSSLLSGTTSFPSLSFSRADEPKPLRNVNGLEIGGKELASPLEVSQRGAVIVPDNFKSGPSSLFSVTMSFPSFSFSRAFEPKPMRNVNGLMIGVPELASPLEVSQRGAVIMPDNGFKLGPSGDVSIGGKDFNPDVVRAALLFFDRLDYPSNTLIQVGETCPAGLEDWEGFQRSRLSVSGEFILEFMTIIAGEVFEGLHQREEGMWAIARGPTQDLIPKDKLNPLSGFKMRLENALPVPDRSVSYEEVLNFKARRRDELAALRSYIDEFAVEISANGFWKYEQTVAFERFDKALGDYYNAATQANFLKRLTSFDISFNLTDAAKGVFAATAAEAAAAAEAVAAAGLPSLESVAIGAVMGLSLSMGLKKKSDRDEPSAFDYVFRASVEM
jgi:hypothetical protein